MHNCVVFLLVENLSDYEFSGTLLKPDHLARPYQNSTLLQKNIIKYGKMVNERPGVYNFTIKGAFKIGWVSHGIENIGSHSVTWKIVLDIAEHMILHIG